MLLLVYQQFSALHYTNSIKDVINSELSQGFQFKAHCGRNGYSLLRQCNAAVNILRSSLRAADV